MVGMLNIGDYPKNATMQTSTDTFGTLLVHSLVYDSKTAFSAPASLLQFRLLVLLCTAATTPAG
jgi:hypothetical protein